MKSVMAKLLFAAWLIVIVTPPLVFLNHQSTAALTQPATAFPFFGLIAFTLVWSQIMLGSFMRPLSHLYPNIFPFHVGQGLLALGFAITHPSLLLFSFLPDRISSYLSYQFVSPSTVRFVYLGQASLLLLILGVGAGLLRNWPPLKLIWHWFHLVHYLVFFFILIHSWNLGSDVQTSPILRSLWLFFLLTVIAGLVYRRIYVVAQEGLVKATS